jgi:hypothetical protein
VQGALCANSIIVNDLASKYQNVSKSENYLLKIKNSYQTEWFRSQTASWNSHYQPEFAEVLTKRGYGFAFNMLPESELYSEK